MSTALIVVIVVVVVAVIALLVLLPRMRERARVRSRERELNQRRDQVVGEHREEASDRERRAAVAEQRARVAEQEAERERAEARVHEEKAALHEKGLADHELVGEGERDDFAGTSAVPPRDSEEPADAESSTRAGDGEDRASNTNVTSTPASPRPTSARSED